MVQMANIAHLHADAVICDPAAGVGDLLLKAYLSLNEWVLETTERSRTVKFLSKESL
jgi:MinD-like ATPase involved in chromosome partitioning or flagellar assembly